jgi:bifunctional non-homologous end joining protein LigD
VLYPEAGSSKADVLDYYARIAPTLLPHLRGRAMTLKRYPDGVAGPHFDDKHCRGAPPWVETAPMWSERKRGDHVLPPRRRRGSAVARQLRQPRDAPVAVGRAGARHAHRRRVRPRSRRAGRILDAAEIALVLHDMLRQVGLESFAKTTGSRGVQVYVPLNSPATFAATKSFSRSVAEVMAARMGDRVVARVDKRLRAGKVLIDWGQNDRHKSTVAAWSLRAKLERPTVAQPLSWPQLTAAVDATRTDDLLPSPQPALDAARDNGDLFAPVLSVVQRLPAGE